MTYSALMWALAAMFLVGAITAVDIVESAGTDLSSSPLDQSPKNRAAKEW